MTRELKFRAWNDFQMRDWEHVRQDLDWWIRNEYPVMQFTGLKDKNGTEIWEGDIVRLSNSKTFYEVVWQESYYRFKKLSSDTGIAFSVNTYPVEVIGNVHESPELLEGSES